MPRPPGALPRTRAPEPGRQAPPARQLLHIIFGRRARTDLVPPPLPHPCAGQGGYLPNHELHPRTPLLDHLGITHRPPICE
jgi:hypothetical protein